VQLFAEHPGKRATERFWLLYTPVWGAIGGLVMLSGRAAHWSDAQLLALGFALAAGALAGPLLFRAREERGKPIRELAGFKLGASVTAVAFLMNYFCTPFFYDVLHMHYGFPTHWNIQNNPVFLYLMTIAYFSTYLVLLTVGWRAAQRLFAGAPRAAAIGGAGIVPFVVAGLETALNANPFMRGLFCFDDLRFMLLFGTFCYGTCFVFLLPVWLAIDERPGDATPLARIGVWVLAATMAIVIAFELYRHLLAPLFTVVEPGANGLRDFGAGCLVPGPAAGPG
jgi:hypothetical protein